MSYRSPKTNQRLERVLQFLIDGSVPELDVGSGLGTLVENSDGNYTITFARAFARQPVAQITVATDVSSARIVSLSTTAINVEHVGADQTTPLADGDLHITVTGWDTAEEFDELL